MINALFKNRIRQISALQWLITLVISYTPLGLMAQNSASELDDSSQLQPLTVFGEAIYRNRTDDINPVLSYDQEFFQRYEPESVGDMLKRVPGVAFNSDVGEYDAPQLRGLPSGFTQVLINGERIPGASADRSVFVDRIPAELVQRIEIVRSPTARLDSQGIGGTINIILKDSLSYQGLVASVGGSYFTGDSLRDIDDKFRGRGSVTYGGQAGDLGFLLSGSFTERRTPKNKETSVFSDGELDEFITERDIRDSDDTAFNWDFDLDNQSLGRWQLDGFYINTDRKESQIESVFEPDVDDLTPFLDDRINVDSGLFEALELTDQLEDINQDQWEIDLETQQQLASILILSAGISYGEFNEDIETTEIEFNLEDEEREDALETINTNDEELEFNLDFDWSLSNNQSLQFGGLARLRDRSQQNREFELDDGVLEEDTPNSGVFDIDENIFAGYLLHQWTPDAVSGLSMEHGVRVEFTDLDTFNPNAEPSSSNQSYTDVNPSASYRLDLSPRDRLRLSAARTLRRPGFDQLTPFIDEEEPDDDSATRGNPALENETAWGIDFGYEQLFADGQGIAGVNLFYRKIDDLIELRNTGEVLEDGTESFDVFSFVNVGDGKLYGIEGDFSAPLSFLSMPNTSLFGNGVLLESEVDDQFTGNQRDFNLTPDYIYNVGFNQVIPAWGLSFGLSYQRQGKILDLQELEDEVQSRDGFLEAFIEKRFNDQLLLRLTGSNLLDQLKVERKTNFDSLQDRIDMNVDSTEIELEETGPWFRLVLRAAF